MEKETEKIGKTETFGFAAVTALFFCACFAALYLPQQAASGVSEGIRISTEILLPSIYPFMFLSAFASEYGISKRLGRFLSPAVKALFWLPGECSVAILMSIVGGYPVGAAAVKTLLSRGAVSEKQARRMLCFCVNPGPAFLISAVGETIYKSRAVGVVLFFSQTTASLITGIILGVYARRHEKLTVGERQIAARKDFSESFVSAAKTACSGCVTLCTMVVLFSAFSTLLMSLSGVAKSSQIGVAVRAVLEVTDGISAVCEMRLPIYVTAVCIGWGGLSVHFQIFASMASLAVNKAKFALSRLCVGFLSAGIAYIIFRYTDICKLASAEIYTPPPKAEITSFSGGAALLLSSVMFVIFVGKDTQENINNRIYR